MQRRVSPLVGRRKDGTTPSRPQGHGSGGLSGQGSQQQQQQQGQVVPPVTRDRKPWNRVVGFELPSSSGTALEDGTTATAENDWSSESSSGYDSSSDEGSGSAASSSGGGAAGSSSNAAGGAGSAAAGAVGQDYVPTLADFKFGSHVLGKGSYGVVKVATEIKTGKDYAVKILEKAFIVKENKVKYVHAEKDILQMTHHRNIVKLFWSLMDRERLYFVLELCPNGVFEDVVKQFPEKKLPKVAARFFTAELVSALSHLCSLGVVHRDVKLDNMLIGADGHLRLTDFGTAKVIGHGRRGRASSFSGTAEYVPPELLDGKTTTLASDMWAVGIVLFQFVSGRVPFKGGTEYQTFQLISAHEFDYDPDCDQDIREAIDALLVEDPDKRARLEIPEGASDDDVPVTEHIYDWVRKLKFFKPINWDTLSSVTPPDIKALASGTASSSEGAPLGRVTVDRTTQMNALMLAQQSGWRHVLLENEEFLYSGVVTRQRRKGSSRHMLLLAQKSYSRPRILLGNPDTNEIDSKVPWSDDSIIETEADPKEFVLSCGDRLYELRDPNGAAPWIQAVRSAHEKWQSAKRKHTEKHGETNTKDDKSGRKSREKTLRDSRDRRKSKGSVNDDDNDDGSGSNSRVSVDSSKVA